VTVTVIVIVVIVRHALKLTEMCAKVKRG